MREEDVTSASKRFYDALNSVCAGDAKPMDEVWSHTAEVTASHPMGAWLHGWEMVKASWDEFAEAIESGSVTPEGLVVHIHGDVAITTAVEVVNLRMGGNELSWRANVTNVYRREAAGWRMIHHHSDKAPNFEAVA